MDILITGASGFIALHATEQALAAGHRVVGTVRDPNDAERTAALRALPGADERLTLVAADLLDPDPFSAHAQVDAILHMASPYALTVEDAERDLLAPAVAGTLAALRAAAASDRVKRVVLTSSMAAVTDEPDGRVLTAEDWNTASTLSRNPYYFSKAEAERAAWRFLESHAPAFDLVALNPFLVIGPSHTDRLNTSNAIIADIGRGQYPAVLALQWGVVDVRDVAAAHLLALDGAVPSDRYLLAADRLTMADLVTRMRRLGYGRRLPRLDMRGTVGTAVMKLASYTQPGAVGSYLRTHLGRPVAFDTGPSREVLGLPYRPLDRTLEETFADLARWGHLDGPAQANDRAA